MREKKIGLVLGAGSAKGFAHLGVLKVLVENNIKIDYLAGCSMGAIAAALFALGRDLNLLSGFAVNMSPKMLFDPTFPKKGLLAGKKVFTVLDLLTQNKTFEELNIPLSVIATDIEKAEKVVINKGSLVDALRASSAIPGVFVPVQYKDRLLVDGAVLERLPIDEAYAMGADYVIAVDVWSGLEAKPITNIFGTIFRTFDILQYEIGKEKKYRADLIIKPDLSHISSFEFNRAEECIEIGEQAARTVIDQIKELQQKAIEV